MKHKILVEKDLDIRSMDESLIVHCKLGDAPLTRDQIREPKPGQPQYVVQEFFRKQIRIVGSCLVLAWEGDGIVAKMHFTTRELHEELGCCCVDPDPDYRGRFAERIQAFTDEELERLMKSESRTLRVLCFNVGHTDLKWHGHGIAKAMLEYLKQWARDHGWRRIEARSCPDITPTIIIAGHMLRRGAFERRGFHVAEETTVPPEEAAHRLREIEAFLAGSREYPEWEQWYADNVHRLAAGETWRSEYDKVYLMACDL